MDINPEATEALIFLRDSFRAENAERELLQAADRDYPDHMPAPNWEDAYAICHGIERHE